MSNPFIALGLTEAATQEEIKAAFRELCKTCHPDAGGSSEAFQTLKAAYEKALDWAGKDKPCIPCEGTGRIKTKGGFFTGSMACMDCGGTGKRRI